LFTTYQQNGRILWVIPDSLLGRDMSLTTTILEGAVHIPVDTRSAFPVISVQSPVSIQYRWQS